MISISERAKRGFLAVVLVLIIATNALAYKAMLNLAESSKWVGQTQETLAAINEFVAALSEAESDLRTYVMTSEEHNLKAYFDVVPEISARFAKLRDLTTDNPNQQSRLNSLEPLTKDKLRAMAEMLQAYSDKSGGAESMGVWLRRSIAFKDQIRLIAQAMTGEENKLYEMRRQAEANSANWFLLIIVAAGTISVVVVGALFYLLSVEGRRLRSANEKLQNVNAEIETRVGERTEQLDRAVMELREEVSTRRKAEETLRSTQVFLDLVIENIPAMISVKDVKDHRFILVNRAHEKLMGYDRSEILGKNDYDFFPKEQADFFVARNNEFLKTGKFHEMAEDSISTAHDGIRLLRTAKILVPGEDGRPELFLSVSEDITERKSVEGQLRQAQKMEAIGNLTGGMAHDFNNLLSIIIGNLDLLRGRLRGGAVVDPEIEQLSGEALDAALRGADLTRRLLAFARRQPLQPQRIDINELVESISKLVDRTLGEDIEIRLDLGADAWPVVADPAQLEAGLVNIVNNARDAMLKGGVLTIATGNRILDEDYTALHPGLAAGNYTMIEISDTGTGIPPEMLNHIFEPFFTTKEQGKGTGLGLSMVFGFMKQSGGHINVYSEAGHGTTFRLYLPRVTTTADAVAARPVALDRGGHQTILAVEDNEGLRRVVRRQLDELGYRVLEAEDGAAALKILESDPVDILFTDIVMPGGLNGYDLARTAVARWPAMKVLLTSGFPETKLNGNGGAPVNMRLLTKPYRKGDLARVLREILDVA